MGMVLLAIAVTAVYWVGVHTLGVWTAIKVPWKEYCHEYTPPEAVLANASQEEVARNIVTSWLESYKSNRTDPFFRIRDHKIIRLQDFLSTDEGFVCMVEVEVKPYRRPPKEIGPGTTLASLGTGWIIGNGVLEDGWIKEKIYYVWLRQDGDKYSWVDIGTAPPWLLDPDKYPAPNEDGFLG